MSNRSYLNFMPSSRTSLAGLVVAMATLGLVLALRFTPQVKNTFIHFDDPDPLVRRSAFAPLLDARPAPLPALVSSTLHVGTAASSGDGVGVARCEADAYCEDFCSTLLSAVLVPDFFALSLSFAKLSETVSVVHDGYACESLYIQNSVPVQGFDVQGCDVQGCDLDVAADCMISCVGLRLRYLCFY